jgi:hypothetical protein
MQEAFWRHGGHVEVEEGQDDGEEAEGVSSMAEGGGGGGAVAAWGLEGSLMPLSLLPLSLLPLSLLFCPGWAVLVAGSESLRERNGTFWTYLALIVGLLCWRSRR